MGVFVSELPEGFALDPQPSSELPQGFQLDAAEPPTPPPGFTADESVTKFQPTVRNPGAGISLTPSVGAVDDVPTPQAAPISDAEGATAPVGSGTPTSALDYHGNLQDIVNESGRTILHGIQNPAQDQGTIDQPAGFGASLFPKAPREIASGVLGALTAPFIGAPLRMAGKPLAAVTGGLLPEGSLETALMALPAAKFIPKSSPEATSDFLNTARSGLPAEGNVAEFQRGVLNHFGYDDKILGGMTTDELASAYKNFTQTWDAKTQGTAPQTGPNVTPTGPINPPESPGPMASVEPPVSPTQPGSGGASVPATTPPVAPSATSIPSPSFSTTNVEPTQAPQNPIFVSRLKEVIDTKLPNSASPEQIMATVKNSPGVKQEEIDATGLQNFLNGYDGAPVPKADVVAHIEDNQVRVEEVVKAAPTIANRAAGFDLNPQYPEYTLPGPKSNYRELLLTLPPQKDTTGMVRSSEVGGLNYSSPHFAEANILAHVRFTERTDINQQPLLFLEELQSDWHQTGRKEGYAIPGQTLDTSNWKATVSQSGLGGQNEYIVRDGTGNNIAHVVAGSEIEAIGMAKRVRQPVPDAPFKTSWPELALKRMFRWAVDNGFERLAWTNGRAISDVVAPGSKDALQGNQEFYDKIVPSIAKKWTKKFGGEFGQTKISTANARYAIAPHDLQIVNYITIPPRAKTFVQQGLPLFSRLERKAEIVVEGSIADTAGMIRYHEGAIKVAQVLQTLNSKFNINAPVRIHLVESIPRWEGGIVAANITPQVDGSYDIKLATSAHKNVAELYASAIHEFGHLVAYEKFAKLPTEQQLAIRGKWYNFRLSTPNSSTLEQLWTRRDNAVVNYFSLRGVKSGLKPLYSLNPEVRKYWSSFDEWFAEQVARWGTSADKPLGVAEKSFKNLGVVLRQIFEQASKKLGMDFSPVPEMKTWLDSFIDTAMPVGSQVYPVVDQRTQAANQTQIDKVEPELQAAEQQIETIGLRATLNSVFPEGVPTEVKNLPTYADKINWFYKLNLHAYQMLELNPHIEPFQRYMEKIRLAELEEAKINDSAIRTMKDWDGLGKVQGERLAKLLDDVTNMVYRSSQERARGIARHPTTAEFQALVKANKVVPDGVKVFTRIKKMFDTFVQLNEGLAMQDAMAIVEPKARADAVDAVKAHTAALMSRPYFPFMRFGEHVVLVRNAAGRIVYREHVESRGLVSGAARQTKRIEELKPSFPGDHTVEGDLLPQSVRSLEGMPSSLLRLIEKRLTLTAQQRDAMEQLKFELSPAYSYSHRLQHKVYLPGYSMDFKRAFAQYFFHGAKWYTRTKYADALRADIQAVREQANATSLTPIKRKEIANFMADHLQNGFLAPAQDFLTVKGAAVFMTLAFTPISAAVNMSQVPMVSLPFLGAKFGDLRAGAALSKAIGNWSNYYKKGKIQQFSDFHSRAMDYAIRTGRLDQTVAAELASWSQGSNLGTGYGGNMFQRGTHTLMQKAMWMFEMAEKWNRRITYSATLDLAGKTPDAKFIKSILPQYEDELQRMTGEFTRAEAEAIITSMHVVDQTQFMASQASRPKIMRGKLGTLFLYKRFVQGMIFTSMNNKADVLPRFILIALALAGLQGIPGYEDLNGIARALAWHLFGKDFNMDREIRKYIMAHTDEKWVADQALHGTARMGFGIPWLLDMLGNKTGMYQHAHVPNLDVSGNIGVGSILPLDVGKFLGPPLKDAAANFGEQSGRVGGVIGGLAFNMYKAISTKDDPGDAKRWESAMPRFARNLSHAYRAFSEGKERGKGDTAIIRYDTRDPEHLGEILALAAGAQPRRLTAQWERITDQNEVTKFFDLQKSMLLEQWATAVKGGDKDEIAKMVRATQEFNADLPNYAKAKALSSDTIKKSITMRLRSQEVQEMGLTTNRSNIPIAQEMQRLHPESTVDVRKVR